MCYRLSWIGLYTFGHSLHSTSYSKTNQQTDHHRCCSIGCDSPLGIKWKWEKEWSSQSLCWVCRLLLNGPSYLPMVSFSFSFFKNLFSGCYCCKEGKKKRRRREALTFGMRDGRQVITSGIRSPEPMHDNYMYGGHRVYQ